MFGMPMHPLLVHFPIVLAVLLPIAAIMGIVLIRRGVRVRAAWTLPVVLAAALWGSAFAATQTGEAEEDRVERVVGEAPLHSHEEAAERFLLFSAVVTVVTLAGYAPRTIGSARGIFGQPPFVEGDIGVQHLCFLQRRHRWRSGRRVARRPRTGQQHERKQRGPRIPAHPLSRSMCLHAPGYERYRRTDSPGTSRRGSPIHRPRLERRRTSRPGRP